MDDKPLSIFWFDKWLEHLDGARLRRKLHLDYDGYCRAAAIAHAEYRCATAIEMVEAKNP